MEIPYEPIRYEYEVPVYSSLSIRDYGIPDNYGIWKYIVIEQDPSPLDYVICKDKKLFPYHQYCRLVRFKSILNFLLGRGQVPFEVFETVMEKVDFQDEKYLWYAISDILGKTGNWKYVNRIPRIMIMMGYGRCFETTKEEFILEKFNKVVRLTYSSGFR